MKERAAMIRVYSADAFVEEVKAALSALPPLLTIRRKGIDARVLSSDAAEMRRAGRRIPESAAELKARGIPVDMGKLRAFLRKRQANERRVRQAVRGDAGRTAERDRPEAPAPGQRFPVRKLEALKVELEALPAPDDADREVGKPEAVRFLGDTILALLRRGFGLDRISALLSERE